MGLAGNSKFLKKLNRLQVFDLIRNNGTISRAEIKNITGLTPTTIGEITSLMVSEGLTLEGGVGDSTGGRPSQLLTLNPEYTYFIGADIDINYIKAAVVDFSLKIISEKRVDTKVTDPEMAIKTLIQIIYELVNETHIIKEKICGIGIGVPGLINNIGIIEFAPNLNWTDADIGGAISEHFSIPVVVENESKLSAVAERHIGQGSNTDSFINVNIRSGVGSGIFIKGHLFKGISGNAGELGHITVKEDGALCGCGNYGCLETLSSTPSIIKRALTCKKQGEASILFETVPEDDAITLENIVDAYKMGDELCLRLLLSASKYIGIGIASVINLINPSRIILGGDLIQYQEILLPKVNEIVEKKALASNRNSCIISVTELGINSTILGAAIACMNKHIGLTDDMDAYMI